ncbi:hypothetical protein SLEP1_g14996 [Rubroshorea leprosula]|uniref:CCHC-type domain-containing protein n=1 Tax=Rubroshorea leprosula TaxID=152421 RepID=A0AAV5IVF2_9ROSI|nr:hypothetical protein SLEP1_g14996 [Rubroshorea leprosula]
MPSIPQLEPSPNMGVQNPPPLKSFRDTLVAGFVSPTHPLVSYVELELLNQQADMVANTTQNRGPRIPSVRLSPEITLQLRENWKNIVIIKLLGKIINHNLLCSRLKYLWKTECEFDMIDLGLGYYTVKFASMEERHRVLMGGPWKIFDHYLAVQPWPPNFCPSCAKAPKTAIWVHFPELSTEYYEEPILHLLGNQVGRIILVDETTLLATCGQYAKVCVEVDLAEQLVSMVDLYDGVDPTPMLLTVAYDLNNVCFHCGEFGHKKTVCPYRQPPTVGDSPLGTSQKPTPTQSANFATLAKHYGPWPIVLVMEVAPPTVAGEGISTFKHPAHEASRMEIVLEKSTPTQLDNMGPLEQGTTITAMQSKKNKEIQHDGANSLAIGTTEEIVGRKERRPATDTSSQTPIMVVSSDPGLMQKSSPLPLEAIQIPVLNEDHHLE